MTDEEKWAFHTDVYAFRAVYLGRYEETSPCDESGRWFDRDLVDRAIVEKEAQKRRGHKNGRPG